MDSISKNLKMERARQCHSAKLKLLHTILKFNYVPIFLAISFLNLGDDHSYGRGYGGGWPFFVGLGNYR